MFPPSGALYYSQIESLYKREAKKGSGDNIPRRVWNRSLPPAAREAGRRSVGNRKEPKGDYASFPDRQPTVIYREANPNGSQGAKRYLALNG